MGINLADHIDIENVDFYNTEGFIELFRTIYLDEEDGSITTDNFMKFQDFRFKVERYQRNRDKLYAQSFNRTALIIYKTEERGMYTQEEAFSKIKEIKEQTDAYRKVIQKKYIELGHLKDIKSFEDFDEDKVLADEPEECELCEYKGYSECKCRGE